MIGSQVLSNDFGGGTLVGELLRTRRDLPATDSPMLGLKVVPSPMERIPFKKAFFWFF